MSDILAPLEQLPQTTRGLMMGTLRAAAATLSKSEPTWPTTPLLHASLVAVKRTSLQLKFLIARDGEEVLFFFVKRRFPTVRALSAQIHVVIAASPPLSLQEREALARNDATSSRSSAQTRYRLRVPSFLWAQPSSADLARYAPPGTTAQTGVLFRLGAHADEILALNHPQEPRRTTVCFERLAETATPVPSRTARPFLLLTSALRDWILSAGAGGTEIPLTLPANPAAQSDVQITLHWLIESYLAMEEIPSHDHSSKPMQRGLSPRYLVSRYEAEVAVCVDRSGHFASAKSEDTVDLGMRLSIRREQACLVATIDLLPPDFLCAGALRERFLQALDALQRKAGLKLPGLPTADAWSDFLATAQNDAIVFRASKRGDLDREIFILPGKVDGQERTLIVRCTAKVDMRATPEKIELAESSVGYDSAAPLGSLLDEETAGYFFRLSAALRDWLQFLS